MQAIQGLQEKPGRSGLFENAHTTTIHLMHEGVDVPDQLPGDDQLTRVDTLMVHYQ